jgi:hypothetical protein
MYHKYIENMYIHNEYQNDYADNELKQNDQILMNNFINLLFIESD